MRKRKKNTWQWLDLLNPFSPEMGFKSPRTIKKQKTKKIFLASRAISLTVMHLCLPVTLLSPLRTRGPQALFSFKD